MLITSDRKAVWRAAQLSKSARIVQGFLSLFFVSGMAVAGDVVRATGEFLFGPETAQNEACDAAIARAKEEAIRQVYKESFSALQQDSCRESVRGTDSRECFYNSFAWSAIDGDIRSFKLVGERRLEQVAGATRCRVTLEVDVVRPDQSSDVNFYFDARVDPLIVRAGDSVSLTIEPAEPMYLAIFGWTPDPSTGKGQIIRIFPNEFDKEPLIKSKTRLPSPQNSTRYDFKVEWAKGTKRDFIDEYLIFVATKSPISWLTEYGFDTFGQRLREIPHPSKRVLKRNYRIVNQRGS
jgi:hypothetical protein